MKQKFRIPYDDKMKLIPIFNEFKQSPFTRAKVLRTDNMPNITSGDIVRWEGENIVKRLGRVSDFIERMGKINPERVIDPVDINPTTGDPYVWMLTDRAIHAITKKPRLSSKRETEAMC